jgi:hypothetical protein
MTPDPTPDATPLDRAHARMQADADDDVARLRFYERLADGELHLLLSEEAQGDSLSPDIVEVGDGRFVLAFDLPERLAQFADGAAHHATMSGRVLARMLAGQGIGLALNPDVAPSAILIPAPALDWLVTMLDNAPARIEARITRFTAPAGLPEDLIAALDAKLSTAAGLARAACLCGVGYDDGSRGYLLGFIDAQEAAQPALAQAVAEALAFSGLDQGTLDVGFVNGDDAMAARMRKAGLGFDLPWPQRPETPERAAPGSDPDRPPILR